MLIASLLLAAVTSAHPRLLLNGAEKARLVAKMNANDPSWLQPGPQTMSAPAVAPLTSNDSQMTGVTIGAQAVLFNSGPAPVTSTSYKSGAARHMLTGMVPNAAYSVTIANGTVHVDQTAGGSRTASSAGVLVFTTTPSRRRAVRQ